MSGYSLVVRLRRFEQDIDALGFIMTYSKYGSTNGVDLIGLKPKDADALPVYARDQELFTGTIEQAEDWIRGIKWARQYDELLRLSDNKKRARKEQDERNRQLMRALKQTSVQTS